MIKSSAILVVILIVAGISFGKFHQTGSLAQEQDKNQAQDKNKIARDKFDNQAQIRIALSIYDPETDKYISPSVLRSDGEMYIAVFVTNRSDQALNNIYVSEFLHERLRLVKDGRIVPYLANVLKKLKWADENEGAVGSIREWTLKPDNEASIKAINLRDWYGTLPPGHYELTLKHRFGWHRNFIESNTITFDVVQ